MKSNNTLSNTYNNSTFHDNIISDKCISNNNNLDKSSNINNDKSQNSQIHVNKEENLNNDFPQKRIFKKKATKQMINYKKSYSELLKKNRNYCTKIFSYLVTI